MSGRTLLSRPRTRIYDANYNIGENYYRPALDRLDRKYSGRPLSPPRDSSSSTGPLRDVLERHERAFADEDLETSRRRAEKHISGRHAFDFRGGRISAAQNLADEFDEETSSSLKRIRAGKKVSYIDDVDLESTSTALGSRRLLDRSEKALHSVGLNESARHNLNQEVSIKKRSVRISQEEESNLGGSSDLTRWTPVVGKDEALSAAGIRARQSKDRLLEIEDEMAAIAEKTAAREKRAARLKALVAESAEETEAAQSAIQALSVRSSRRVQRTIEE